MTAGLVYSDGQRGTKESHNGHKEGQDTEGHFEERKAGIKLKQMAARASYLYCGDKESGAKIMDSE